MIASNWPHDPYQPSTASNAWNQPMIAYTTSWDVSYPAAAETISYTTGCTPTSGVLGFSPRMRARLTDGWHPQCGRRPLRRTLVRGDCPARPLLTTSVVLPPPRPHAHGASRRELAVGLRTPRGHRPLRGRPGGHRSS
jgi:hypothetical protein